MIAVVFHADGTDLAVEDVDPVLAKLGGDPYDLHRPILFRDLVGMPQLWRDIENTLCYSVLIRVGYRYYCLLSRKDYNAIIQPRPHSLRLPEDTDKATVALITASIPAYRNSERCAVSGCGKTRVFIKMDFVCPVHG
jgi:hypothetical protein